MMRNSVLSKISTTGKAIFSGLKALTKGAKDVSSYIKSDEFRDGLDDALNAVKEGGEQLVNASTEFNKYTHVALCKQRFSNELRLILLLYKDPIVQEIVNFLPDKTVSGLKQKMLKGANETITSINTDYQLNIREVGSLDELCWEMIDDLSLEHLPKDKVSELFEKHLKPEPSFQEIKETLEVIRNSEFTDSDKNRLVKKLTSYIETM